MTPLVKGLAEGGWPPIVWRIKYGEGQGNYQFMYRQNLTLGIQSRIAASQCDLGFPKVNLKRIYQSRESIKKHLNSRMNQLSINQH